MNLAFIKMKKIRLLIILAICSSHYQNILSQEIDNTTISASLENWLVEEYLDAADAAYTPTIGREGTSILDYHILGEETAYYYSQIDKVSKPNWAEQPNPITIPTPFGKNLLVSDSPSFANPYTIEISSQTTLVYNLIPQKIYWYRIVGLANEILDQGVFKTLGHMRAIYSPNVENIRDIGGWKCEGGRLAYGKIFRGGIVDNITEEERITLTQLVGIGTDVDLRHDNGEASATSPLGVEAEWEEIMAYMFLITNTWAAPKGGGPNTAYYACVGNMVRRVVDNPTQGGFYYHCAAGADRTGIVIALFEGLCGVSVEDIVKDWELTTFTNYEKFISQEKTAWWHYENGTLLKETGEMRSVFQYMYDNYNNSSKTATFQEQVENWFKKNVFLTAAEQNKYLNGLKNYMIEPDTRNPILIQDGGFNENGLSYLLIDEVPMRYQTNEIAYSSTNGSTIDNEMTSSTDYIDCKDFTYLISNVETKNFAVFYDSSHKCIGGASSSENISDDTVLYKSGTIEYSIPSNAAYVKINIPKFSDAYAILSVNSLK